MPNNSNGRRYKVRYDRIVFVAAILMVLTLILTSCISSCTKKKEKDDPANPNTSSVNDSSGSKTDPSDSASVSPTDTTPKVTYATTELELSDVHRGNLILVNQANPCAFDYAAISEGTSSEVQMTTIKSILDTKTGEYLHYTAADWEVGMDKEAALAMDAWLEDFYETSHNSDVRMISGYRSEAEDLDFRTGRTCTLGIFPTEGSSYVYEHNETFAWIQDNAHKYGFILRYPEGKESYFDSSITSRTSGTFRYVGEAAATYISSNGLCLEEFLETVKSYTIDNMLKVNGTSKTYGMYYVPANANGKTSLSVPSSGTEYTVSGNNKDGFVVTVTLEGSAPAVQTPTETVTETTAPEA